MPPKTHGQTGTPGTPNETNTNETTDNPILRYRKIAGLQDCRNPRTQMENPRAALLIVDVQAGFINDATRHILPKVDALQRRYEHVYATRFINAEGSPYRRLLGWHRFYADSADVPLAFQPVENAVVIDKHVYTCVTPEFLADLRAKRIEEVAVCGIDTDACVSKCAVDLFENGMRPILISDACASHAGAEYHDCALRILRRLIGRTQII